LTSVLKGFLPQVADSTAVNLAKVQALRQYRWLDNYTQKVIALHRGRRLVCRWEGVGCRV